VLSVEHNNDPLDRTNDASWTILPLRVYMPCYIHSFHPHSYSLPKLSLTYAYTPLTYKSHQDRHQPHPADLAPAAAVAVEAGKAGTLDTHPEAALPAVAAVAAAHCVQA
jgi:hypothetical protein